MRDPEGGERRGRGVGLVEGGDGSRTRRSSSRGRGRRIVGREQGCVEGERGFLRGDPGGLLDGEEEVRERGRVRDGDALEAVAGERSEVFFSEEVEVEVEREGALMPPSMLVLASTSSLHLSLSLSSPSSLRSSFCRAGYSPAPEPHDHGEDGCKGVEKRGGKQRGSCFRFFLSHLAETEF